MPYFDKDFIRRVLDATDLAALIREYFPDMRKVSGRWVGVCPFHVEKSGSFGVREGKRFWKCFGCQAGGDAAKFLMMKEGINFPDAITRLAGRTNIMLPDGRTAAEWKPKKKRRTRKEIEAEAEERKLVAVAIRAESSVSGIVSAHSWSRGDMWEEAQWLPEDPVVQAEALLRLFRPADIVWCGVHADSISTEDALELKNRHWLERVRSARPFRTAEEWYSSGALPGPRIVPNAMRPDVLARSDANVIARRFLVIEHDKLGIEDQGAMLRWLSKKLTLRAVIYTGGKSLHGWFECPPVPDLPALQAMLCGYRVERFGGKRELVGGMGFDASVFVPSQPYRVPGWQHDKTGKLVELWWLKP